MFAMLLPRDLNATRRLEHHPRPPRASWTDLFPACWSAVLSLRASPDQASGKVPNASYHAHKAKDGGLGTESPVRRTQYLELRAKYLARSRRAKHLARRTASET